VATVEDPGLGAVLGGIVILVTIEVTENGKLKKLGTMEITNDLSHPLRPDMGNYVCRLTETKKYGEFDSVRTRPVKDHPRHLGWEKLVRDAFGYFDMYHKDEEIARLKARIEELEG
jgi:hypothetical protein